MLSQHVAYSKEFIPVMDDLLDFVLSMGYKDAGARELNLVSYGCYEDPLAYNANYADMGEWAKKRKVSPGVIIDGKLVTQDLIEINVGIQEMVERSYFEDWDDIKVKEDPVGNPLTKNHPWNKATKPAPGEYKNWDGKYSWGTSVRWLDWKGERGTQHSGAGPPSKDVGHRHWQTGPRVHREQPKVCAAPGHSGALR